MVAANIHFTGTHRGVLQIGTWGPWAPTDKSVDVREANFFRLAGGKVVEIWVAWDTATFARQIGGDLPKASATTEPRQCVGFPTSLFGGF